MKNKRDIKHPDYPIEMGCNRDVFGFLLRLYISYPI